MDPLLLIALGFLLVFFVVVLPRLRDRYEEEYEDERAFFREQRPRMWGLIGGMVGDNGGAGTGGETDPDRCPACGTVNDVSYTYCRDCGSRLPVRDE